MAMIDNLIEISLPYLVYIMSIAKVINPIIKKIHAKTHKARDGPVKLSSGGTS